MSSESEVESDNERFYEIRKLTWRSQEATNLFIELDKKADELMNSRSRRQRVKRIRGERASGRSIPSFVPEKRKWAVTEVQS